MRPLYILITVGLLCCGCQGTGPAKIDNPVVGPPPPRLPLAKIRDNQLAAGVIPDTAPTRSATRISIDDVDQSEQVALRSEVDEPRTPSGIQRISLQMKDADLPAFEDSMVVAMVNDQPIFAGEVLAPMRGQLKKIAAQYKAERGKLYKPEMMNKVRAYAVRNSLPRLIERKMLVQAAKAEFKKQQLEGLTKAVDAEWGQHLAEMIKQNQVHSINELEALMAENDFDIDEAEAAFKDEQITMNFISYKVHSKFEPTRKEMLAYYTAHLDDYKFPARAHWQQLVISNEAHGGEEGARKLLDKVVKELLGGADFSEMVKKYGDGPKAANGGIWDWTIQGSLANKELDSELFTLPPGETSGVIKTPTDFQIVQVLDRQDAGCQPFESQQKEIEAKLKQADRSELGKKVIADIKAATVVKTIFDADPAAPKEAPQTAPDFGPDA